MKMLFVVFLLITVTGCGSEATKPDQAMSKPAMITYSQDNLPQSCTEWAKSMQACDAARSAAPTMAAICAKKVNSRHQGSCPVSLEQAKKIVAGGSVQVAVPTIKNAGDPIISSCCACECCGKKANLDGDKLNCQVSCEKFCGGSIMNCPTVTSAKACN